MKHLNKTVFTTTIIALFAFGQPVLAGEEGTHDEYSGHAAPTKIPEMSMSHEKHHAVQDATFGDEANHEGYSAGHSATGASHGMKIPHFTSAEHEAIKKLVFGDASKRK